MKTYHLCLDLQRFNQNPFSMIVHHVKILKEQQKSIQSMGSIIKRDFYGLAKKKKIPMMLTSRILRLCEHHLPIESFDSNLSRLI